MMRVWFAVLTAVTAMSTLGSTGAPAQDDPARAAREWLQDCQDRDHDSQARFCDIRQLGWRGRGRAVSVDAGPNGGVEVHGWDRDSVHVLAKIQTHARSESAARELAGEIDIETAGTLRADGPSSSGWLRRSGWSVSFEVWAPIQSDLDLETNNGPVTVEDVSGRMTMRTSNGPLTLRRLAGDVRAETSNGPLTIELEGARWEGAGLDAETSNGPVTVTIPANYSARLETGTVNGGMNIDFPVTVQGRFSFRRITTDIGQGGPTIRAVTTNGPVNIRRR